MHERTRTIPIQVVGLVVAVVVTFAAAGIGGLGSADAGTFYAELQRPSWAPPGWLFGPVWTVLYTMMAVAAWLVWRRARGSTLVVAMSIYGAQLVANALWSWIFFAWRLGSAAFIEIVALWVLVAATAAIFGRIDRLAAALLLPYAAWVAFAAALTLALWRLNPGLLH